MGARVDRGEALVGPLLGEGERLLQRRIGGRVLAEAEMLLGVAEVVEGDARVSESRHRPLARDSR